MKIRLMGYRCSGKSSVGRALALELGVPFWDTDRVLESRVGKSIQDMVAYEGWESFRAMEREVLMELLEMEPAVLALGGGAVLDPINRLALRQQGLNVWLVASAQTILERMAQDPESPLRRPALTSLGPEEEVRSLLREREPLYREVAHVLVYTDHRPVEKLVREILELLGRAVAETHSARGT